VDDETRARRDLGAQIEAFRALLREARERRITPDEYAAVVEVTEAVLALLREREWL
jgi:hypothetical protein